MKTLGNLNVLDDDRENRKILIKLPDWMINRWARLVAEYKSKHRMFPPFSEFSKFVQKEAKIARDPVT
jgi:hypothetical protein